MNPKNILKPVEAQLIAYNNRDIEAFVLNFAPECVCEDQDGNPLMTGRAAMYERYGQMFAHSPDLLCRIVSRTVVGQFVFDEERVAGRNGSPNEGRVMAVYTVNPDTLLIDRVRFYR